MLLEPTRVVDDVATGGKHATRLVAPARTFPEGEVGVPTMSPGVPRPPVEWSANQRPAMREPSQRLTTRGSSSTCASQDPRESPASIGSQIA
jgi:hypothetical protein